MQPKISKILYEHQSCILFKKLDRNLLQQEKICTSHCFIFVVKGCVEVQTSTGETLQAESSEILFMPRDTYLISDFITRDNSIEMYLVFIEHDIVNSFINQKTENEKQDYSESTACRIKSSVHIEQYFNSIMHVYKGFENNTDLLKLKIIEFLHLVYASNKNNIISTLSASEHHKKNCSLSNLMLENYDKNLNVSDFASLSGRSLSSFNRDFKRKYGKPPKQWLIELKMQKAAQLLASGSNVSDCANDVGYINISHFIKSYKSFHGKKPSEMKIINL